MRSRPRCQRHGKCPRANWMPSGPHSRMCGPNLLAGRNRCHGIGCARATATTSFRGCASGGRLPPPAAAALRDCGEPRPQANHRLGTRYRCWDSGSCQLLLGCLDILCDLSDRSGGEQLGLRHGTAVIKRGATSKHAQCNSRPRLARAKTAASTTSSAAINPRNPAETIQTLARKREVILSVISALASWISFCTRSPRSPKRSLSAWVRPEFRNRSYAMELSRTFEPLTAATAVAGTAGIRIALEHAQKNEARKRGQAKNKGGLSAGEVGCGPHQLLGGLAAHVFRELLHPLGRAAYKIGELRCAAVEAVGGRTHRVGNVTRQVGAGRHLLRQEALCPVIGVRCERRGGLLRLGAGLLRDIGELRHSFACFCSDALLRSRLAGSR